MDANRMPLRTRQVDNHPGPIGEPMGARTNDTRQRTLKKQVAHNSYTVDPERVATAIIVKLVQGGPSAPDPLSGGPTRRARGADRFRQAA